MRARTGWLIALAVTVGLAATTRADDAPLARKDLDGRIDKLIFDTISVGADVFNAGDQGGCFRLYQGTVMALVPMLDHRPKLMAMAKQSLDMAKGQRPAEGAFTLRKALDEIRAEVGSGAGGGTTTKKALWDRLGGEGAVSAVVHDFVIAAASDPKVNFFRDGKYTLNNAQVAKLERQLVELISAVSGGPLKYTGRDMKSSHKGMKITDAEFDALAGHLVATLKKYKVPQAEIDELVGIVATTKKDIVEPAGPKVTGGTLPTAKKPLWDRLGGEEAVSAVVHDFVVAAATDPKVNFDRDKKFKFTNDDIKKLERQLVELISAVSGGPLKYTGRDMKASHKGMKITEAEFNAIAGHLVATLKKYKVPQAEIDELVGIVATTKKDIVEE